MPEYLDVKRKLRWSSVPVKNPNCLTKPKKFRVPCSVISNGTVSHDRAHTNTQTDTKTDTPKHITFCYTWYSSQGHKN